MVQRLINPTPVGYCFELLPALVEASYEGRLISFPEYRNGRTLILVSKPAESIADFTIYLFTVSDENIIIPNEKSVEFNPDFYVDITLLAEHEKLLTVVEDSQYYDSLTQVLDTSLDLDLRKPILEQVVAHLGIFEKMVGARVDDSFIEATRQALSTIKVAA